MSRIDERLEERFRRYGEPAASNDQLERVAARRRRVDRRRRVGSVVLAVGVLGGTLAGYLALSRAFGDNAEQQQPAGPQNGSLVVVRTEQPDTSEQRNHLELVPADGSPPERLTRDTSDWVKYLGYSPDGRYVSYTQTDGGAKSSITIIDLVTGGQTSLGDDTAIGGAWSPDGTQIAYWDLGTEDALVGGGIRVVPADRSGPGRIVTGDSVVVGRPSWSPDGSEIAFEGLDGGTPYVMVLDLATGDVRKVTFTDGDRDPNPIWSPEGTMIDFAFQGGIWQVESSGDAKPTLLAGPSFVEHSSQRFPDSLANPSWSPDGRLMMYVLDGSDIIGGSETSGYRLAYTHEVYVDALDGSPPTHVTSGSEVVWLPQPSNAP